MNICIFDQCQTVFLQSYAIHTKHESVQFIPCVKMHYLLLSFVFFGLSYLVNGKNKTQTQALM